MNFFKTIIGTLIFAIGYLFIGVILSHIQENVFVYIVVAIVLTGAYFGLLGACGNAVQVCWRKLICPKTTTSQNCQQNENGTSKAKTDSEELFPPE